MRKGTSSPFDGFGSPFGPRRAGGGGGGPPSLYSFELVNEAGSTTITAWPGLRVRINGGSWQTLSAAGLTISQTSSGVLAVDGFNAGQTTVEFHLEQQQPGEPYSAADTVVTADTTGTSISSIYARKIGGPYPAVAGSPGIPIIATTAGSPVTV